MAVDSICLKNLNKLAKATAKIAQLQGAMSWWGREHCHLVYLSSLPEEFMIRWWIKSQLSFSCKKITYLLFTFRAFSSNLHQFIHTFIHWWQWLPCKVLTSTSGTVWSSVSCPRTLWHADQGNQKQRPSDNKTLALPLSHSRPVVGPSAFTPQIDRSRACLEAVSVPLFVPQATAFTSAQIKKMNQGPV